MKRLHLKDLHDGMIVYAGETRNGVTRLRVLSHQAKILKLLGEPDRYTVFYTFGGDDGSRYKFTDYIFNELSGTNAFRLFRKEKHALAWSQLPETPIRRFQYELNDFRIEKLELDQQMTQGDVPLGPFSDRVISTQICPELTPAAKAYWHQKSYINETPRIPIPELDLIPFDRVSELTLARKHGTDHL